MIIILHLLHQGQRVGAVSIVIGPVDIDNTLTHAENRNERRRLPAKENIIASVYDAVLVRCCQTIEFFGDTDECVLRETEGLNIETECEHFDAFPKGMPQDRKRHRFDLWQGLRVIIKIDDQCTVFRDIVDRVVELLDRRHYPYRFY